MGKPTNDTLILKEIQAILCEVLKSEITIISPSQNASDFENWDSFSHMEIINAIENHYQIKFSLLEVMRFHEIQDIVNAIKAKFE